MKSLNKLAVFAGVAAASLMCVLDASAQGGGRAGGQRGGMDPTAQIDAYQTTLEIPDADWSAVRTLLERVLIARADVQAYTSTSARGGGGGRGGAGGGLGGGGGFTLTTTSTNAVVTNLVALVSSGTTEDINKAMAAYRSARATAEANLTAAQNALKKVLKVGKQEAIALRLGLVN